MNRPQENKMKRHSSNRNLTLYFETTYEGLPIMHTKGPFIREYLSVLHRTMTRAITQYREVFAFRFDCRLPSKYQYKSLSYQNEVVDRFLESFKAKTRHNRQKAIRDQGYAHDSMVRFVWAREVAQRERPHYHFVIFLNKDAFCALGRYEPGIDNIYNRLHEAWASALGLPLADVWGLVHIPEKARYYLRRDDSVSLETFFRRASYLCKAATKAYGDGSHGLGASRS
jgi:hypothetical protein